MKETIEQYLARGGKIKQIPFGESGETQHKLVRQKERYVYETPYRNSYKRNYPQ